MGAVSKECLNFYGLHGGLERARLLLALTILSPPMPRLDKVAHPVAIVPFRVDRLSGVDPHAPPESSSQPNPYLPRFNPRLIINTTLRILCYVERRVRPSDTLQLTSEGVQESTAKTAKDTTKATPPPIARPRIHHTPVALIPKKGL
ncbi:hypothetical protein FRC00_004293 [Tulasnella sp. 408]|nr:hypothetical protein FRC00_004293 [Tulasnella sp. 408]